MTSVQTGHRQALAHGLGALAKSLLLVAGVPIATLRLWLFGAQQRYPLHIGLIIDIILATVGLFWVAAVVQLVGEVIRAIRSPGERLRGSWSSSWATGIVGLLLLAGALSVHGSQARPPTPIVQTTHAPVRNMKPITGDVSHRIALEIVAGLGALVTGGLLRRTQLLARLRVSIRDQGRAVSAPAVELRPLLRALHTTDDDRLIDWIEATNRVLGKSFADHHATDIPEIALVRVGPGGIEILLVSPLPDPPPCFVSSHGGWWWRVDPQLGLNDLRGLGHNAPRFIPVLIPVGSDGAGEILVALSAKRVLGICGAGVEVDATIDACVVALRVLPWCDEIAVEMIGLEPPPLDEQSAHMQQSTIETLETLNDRKPTSRQFMSESWRREPLVVVHRSALDTPSRERLIAATARFAAIVGGTEGDVTLAIDGDTAILEPYKIRIQQHGITAAHQSTIDRLLSAYAQPADVVKLHAPKAMTQRSFDINDHIVESQTRELEIQMLGGRVEIVGAHHRAHRDDVDRVHELLVYLAMHDYHATSALILEELFVNSADDAAYMRLENVVAITRTVLGRTQRGLDRVRSSVDDSITLDRSVGLDWHRIASQIVDAQMTDGEHAVKELRSVLLTIDDLHLLGEVSTYPWFRAMRYDEHIKTTLIDACHHLATLAQASGDSELVRRALDLGISIEPASEIMARDHMVLAESTGNITEVKRVYKELQQSLHGLGGAEPSVITHRLYLSLVAVPDS